jgi:hypothetical protein
MPPGQLDDRIRNLCAKALGAQPAELDEIFEHLKIALHEHTEHLKTIAASKIARNRA